ncbi:SDR family oxidoreductase [Peptoniphilus sp. KCTC 25270]|uniref:SDR family NAD(P)-dependent oxidoreductase n=1 Tax=Peptoniphilus sp. KCTC 25270 TaxID=2897414 RepID=UPI001E4E851A|nr:SDR family oxidoreductase [Peptoniphilus sp. KCTC 25270]MCD1147537.1 SDR family oxidoreductase [Peptoniphilus sp. KCTC 25270]
MKVLITGTSRGIGEAIGKLFLEKGHKVIGMDKDSGTIHHENYVHYQVDICDYENLPEIEEVEVLINNAGGQNEDSLEKDIDVNLKALIHITEKYGIQPKIRSILSIGSASGHTGAEFPAYCASKGGIVAYTKNVAMRIAPFGATCNSLDPGGVITPLNRCVMEEERLWAEIMEETPLKRWATVEEMADWAYFLTAVNGFCTGQSIVVDGGESTKFNFVWPS